jgi:cytochrome c peroxidase
MKLRVIVFLSILVIGCKKVTETDLFINFEMPKPDHFPKVVYNNPKNKVTVDGFNLGKRLFNDPILSIDSSIACVNCHAPEHSFADHNTALSKGVNGRFGLRNSPALFNLAWHTNFNWDGGVNHLEVFSIAPIENQLEMADTLRHVLFKLNRNSFYRTWFKKVFNTDTILDKEFMYALTQYMVMLVSSDAKYDRVIRGEASFTPTELNGYEVFKAHCNSCHTEPLFMTNEFKNNGYATSETDLGRMLITQKETDKHKFKVPSLRNLKFTYPYMHNGGLWSLNAVLDHYQKPKPQAVNAEPMIKNGIFLTPAEREDLLEFLNTLNDYTFINNKQFR